METATNSTETDPNGAPEKPMTLREVATLLRCSKAHLSNLLNGKVQGVPKLPCIALGRRKLIRPSSLARWMAEAEQDRL